MTIEAEVLGKEGKLENEFCYPQNICLKENKLYVCDSFNDRIQIYNIINDKLIYSSTIPNIENPHKVKISSNDLIYVSQNNRNICIYNQSGNLIKEMNMAYHYEFVLDESDRIILTDYHENKIFSYDNGHIKKYDIQKPRLIQINNNGDVLVVCGSHLSNIKVLDKNFNELLDIQSTQSIYSCHTDYSDKIILGFIDKIKILEPSTQEILEYGVSGTGIGQFYYITGIASYDKNIIISDCNNHRLQIIKNIL